MAKLDAGLGGLVRKGTGIPDHPKLKRALGLSTRRAIHHWNKAGAPTQLPGYASNIDGVAKAGRLCRNRACSRCGYHAYQRGLPYRKC